jgi:hypothetical protein
MLNSNVHGMVKFSDGSVVEIEGIDTILFVCKNGEHRLLPGVYMVEKLTTNIISLGQLDEIDYEIGIRERVLKVCHENQRLLARVEQSSNNLYVLQMEIAQLVSLVAKRTKGAWLWHSWFGHLNFHPLRTLAQQEMVKGLHEIELVDKLCRRCLVGKQRRASFPRQIDFRADQVLELVHGDIYGPISPTTPSGNHYFIL